MEYQGYPPLVLEIRHFTHSKNVLIFLEKNERQMVFRLCLPRADCWENLVWLMVPGEEKVMSPGGGAVPLAGPSLCHHPLSSLSSEDSPDKGFR